MQCCKGVCDVVITTQSIETNVLSDTNNNDDDNIIIIIIIIIIISIAWL